MNQQENAKVASLVEQMLVSTEYLSKRKRWWRDAWVFTFLLLLTSNAIWATWAAR